MFAFECLEVFLSGGCCFCGRVVVEFDSERVCAFQREIMDFYEEFGRHDLLFRKTSDPFLVHISEVMLSQTQVGRVEEFFERWVERFSGVGDVVSASRVELLEFWQGLGYNSRVLNFQVACGQVVEEFSGVYPRSKGELMRLKGVGPYVASAICAFAFNLDVGVVDTNVRRILIHFGFADEGMKQRELEEVAFAVCLKGRARDWNNALMDYGALKLTARRSGVGSVSKQGRFVGSSRYVRSLIVKRCLAVSCCLFADVEGECLKYGLELRGIVEKLEREGVVEVDWEVGRIVLVD